MMRSARQPAGHAGNQRPTAVRLKNRERRSAVPKYNSRATQCRRTLGEKRGWETEGVLARNVASLAFFFFFSLLLTMQPFLRPWGGDPIPATAWWIIKADCGAAASSSSSNA